MLLGALHTDLLRSGEADRLSASLRALVDGLLATGTSDQASA